LSRFEGHFEGAKTLGVKKVEAPSKCPEKWLTKLLSQKKKIMSQSFLNSGTLEILCLFATMGPQLCPAVS
jgi:hypothetical protein